MPEREFVTAVDQTDPLKGNRTVFALDVYYDVPPDCDISTHLETMDSCAFEAAGCEATASGCGGECRDLEFWFSSDDERRQAKSRLQEAGFRFFCHAECLTGD